MKFLKQIKYEIVNIIRSKFLLIMGILVLLIGIAVPIINAVSQTSNNNDGGYPRPLMYSEAVYAYDMKGGYYPGGDYGGGKPITVDGVTIEPDNPSYWNINNLKMQQESAQDGSMSFANPQTANLAYDLFGAQIQYYLHYAKAIPKDYMDYRLQEVQWVGMNYVTDKFYYEHADTDPAVLMELQQMFGPGMEETAFKDKYVNITAEAKLAAIDKADENLNKVFDLVDNDNFPVYIDLMMQQAQTNIETYNDQIDALVQEAQKHPDQQQMYDDQIKGMQDQIDLINEDTIPTLQYRLEKGIRPGGDSWQNNALSDIQNSRSWLKYNAIVDEDKFNQDYNGIKTQYGTYANYVATMNKQVNKYTNTVIIAQNSLDADKPDMKYVPDGARYITVQFLDYSIIVALLGILVGAWIMGSEFQQGTIRLLLIRPRTRTKILMAKFLAALIACLVIYFVGSILNLLTNGICFGFADFGFPNYTVTGPIGFFGPYILALLACSVTVIFAFSVAFMLSMLIKIIAVSIAIPVVCYIGCTLLMARLAYARLMAWIAYTPIPYVQLPSFFKPQSMYAYDAISQLTERGMPLSAGYGIMILLVLSGICVAVSILAFRKRDITN